MRSDTWLRGAVLAACVTLGAPALAQKSADTLRVTWRDAIPDVDPYYNSQRTGMVVAFQAFDCLVYRDPTTMEMKPALATSWKQVDATTLEFTLREGVTFQNGDPFTADDVVYTINTIIHDKKVAIPAYYTSLAGAEKIDDFHVRIKLAGVSPAIMEYLSMVTPIWPKAYREKVGPEAFSKAPIGTGPYKITKVDGTTQIDLERFDGYYTGSPKGKPAIKYIKIHEVPDATTEMTELLGGRADWIWGYNADQYDNIARVPTLQALRFGIMRVNFMTIDAAGRTGAGNPLTKQKVRQAIIMAIDRATMAKQLIQGDSQVIDTPCFPTQVGCDVAAAVKYPYDPVRAKQLLNEAGYPNGFDTELISYNTPQINAALQNYLRRSASICAFSNCRSARRSRRLKKARLRCIPALGAAIPSTIPRPSCPISSAGDWTTTRVMWMYKRCCKRRGPASIRRYVAMPSARRSIWPPNAWTSCRCSATSAMSHSRSS